MWPYLIAGLVAMVLGLTLLLWQLTLRFHVEGFGAPAGNWALAGALTVGPLVATFIGAQGGVRRVEVSCWRWKFAPRLRPRRREKEAPQGPSKEVAEDMRQAKRPSRGVSQVADVFGFVLAQRKRVRAEKLDLECDYGFSDVALTGKFAAALTVLSGVVPRPVRLVHRPRWVAEDRAAFQADGAIRLELLPLLWATAGFMLRNWRQRKRLSASRNSNYTLQEPQREDS